MHGETAEVSFGGYLRAIREQRGISIQDVSEWTKIPVYLLRSLEGEALERLPEPVYVKGFIRSYAEAVGANAAEAVRMYLNRIPQPPSRALGLAPPRPRLRKRFWSPLLLSLAGFVGIILLSVWGMSVVKDSPPSPIKPQYPAGLASPAPEKVQVEESKLDPAPGLSATDAAAPPGGWLLDMKAVLDTWVRVTIDDHGPKEYQLKSGDQLALKAESGFLLHIGDPSAVVMKLNGNPYRIEGKSGTPVKLKLPE